ncbi:TRAP transporter large permease [Cognatiyoonia sp. IB215182]|uniref:TRAP transporter large permease n=1 Tax=Cognatiyoonia sp. IB215182 TaxID=3097353 RepID=UPI002A14A347|nr:TRAP transporter large permease [Cognatiyoonia sp. IB215182]MDX8352957.1 TRAP transporter large permease [Cognatiyoonia sp. IB215182]
MTVALICFAIVIALVLVRVPIGIAMGLVGAIGFVFLRDWRWSAGLGPAADSILDVTQNDALSVIPLFILMGMLIAQSGMAHDLYRAAYAAVGRLPGGLAMSTILACGGFSAVSGSSLATAATMSQVALPSMRKYGYHDTLSTASVAAGGTLGILIPPSIILIIYGFLTGQSIGKLFLAGILPGILGVVLYLIAVAFVVWHKPEAGPAGAPMDAKEARQSIIRVIPILILFVIIIGGIYAGIFTADEAAGVGAFGAIVISVAIGRFSWSGLVKAVSQTVTTSVGLFVLLIGADIFNRLIIRTGLPDDLLALVNDNGFGPFTVLAIMMLIYLVLGAVFESLSMITLTVPLFAPLIASLGFFEGDVSGEMALIWFGIIVVVVTEISLITPPIGLNVFVLRSVVPDVSTGTIFRGVTPFWLADIVRLIILIALPAFSLLLPLGVVGFGGL